MKKSLLLALIFLPLTSFALTCPQPELVYERVGSQVKARAPTGWRFQQNWPSKLDSDNVKFVLAAYGADLHPPTDADNHVRCYYGNPVLEPDKGVAIESEAVIPENAIESHHQWLKHEHYYLCGRDPSSVNDCPFG